jgi:hypothetical protein
MKSLHGILLLGVSTLLAMGQIAQISFSQNTTNDTGLLSIPEFEPQDSVSKFEDRGFGELREPEPEPVSDRIAAQIEFEPSDTGLEDYYDVSNFAMNTMENSELCPPGNCDISLDGGQLDAAFIPGERLFSGKLRVSTDESSRIMDLLASWETVEERANEEGETIQYIEGTLAIGRDVTNPEFDYRINGTMTPDGDNYLVALHGER